MKKFLLAALLWTGAAAFSTAGAQQPAQAPSAPAAEAPSADKPAAPAAEAKPEKKKSWWRNRQIERGPRALRPGHHRRLLRHSR
jgi:hypothetical protein